MGLENIPTHGEVACSAVVRWRSSASARGFLGRGSRWKDVMCCYSEAVRCAGPMGSKG